MKFQEKFNEVCAFPDYFGSFDEIQKALETEIRTFNKEYDAFKKEHGLENLYFSRVAHIESKTSMITEVWFEISDLYLTYLEANNCLPKGALVERYLIKEQYLYNTQKEWLFRDSMFEAVNQQEAPKEMKGIKVYRSSLWEGLTERIKMSNPTNGLPAMIIERIPMTYDDLKNLNSK